jgi:hypothetical protein
MTNKLQIVGIALRINISKGGNRIEKQEKKPSPSQDKNNIKIYNNVLIILYILLYAPRV